MNKEEMINALNSLAARIKAGQLDIDDVALRNVVKSFGAIPEERMDISTALLPDELMTCNFNDCETVCHKCSNFICDHIGLVRYVKNDT